ncbi:MAG: hypothetical protein QXX20_00660 [Candidatus Thermoplasmatota archaeon]
MKIDPRLFIIGMALVISTMVAATQFALIDLEYQYQIIHPVIPDYGIHYMGSDNASDGIRVLRVINTSGARVLKVVLGAWGGTYQVAYTAAVGIVNEDNHSVAITHVEVRSLIENQPTYLKIWLHGNRTSYADNTTHSSSILLYDNGTCYTNQNTIAWVLARGDNNASTICSNYTTPAVSTIPLLKDERAGVRYSYCNIPAVSGYSDFVWVQIELDVPYQPVTHEQFSGSIIIHYQSLT